MKDEMEDHWTDLSPIKRKDKNCRIIAWIADLHVLSRYAVAPPGFKSAEGNPLPLNKAQKILYGYWMEFIKTCDELKVDTVGIPGDLGHGQNVREMGVTLMSTDMDDQESAVVKLLKPLCKGRRVFIWRGSGYHISTKGHNVEKDICDNKELAKVAESTHWMGPISNIQFPPSEKIFNVQHGTSAAYIYLAMLMERTINEQLQAEAIGAIPDADVIIQGHLHHFRHLHEHKKHMILLPCWQIYDPNRITLKSYGKFQPDIGGVITVLDEKDRLKVWHYLYPLPHLADVLRKG